MLNFQRKFSIQVCLYHSHASPSHGDKIIVSCFPDDGTAIRDIDHRLKFLINIAHNHVTVIHFTSLPWNCRILKHESNDLRSKMLGQRANSALWIKLWGRGQLGPTGAFQDTLRSAGHALGVGDRCRVGQADRGASFATLLPEMSAGTLAAAGIKSNLPAAF